MRSSRLSCRRGDVSRVRPRSGSDGLLGGSQRLGLGQRLGGYVRLRIEERHEAVRELTAEGMSARKIADVVGVSHETVARDVRNLTPPEPPAELGPGVGSSRTSTPGLCSAGKLDGYTADEYGDAVKLAERKTGLGTVHTAMAGRARGSSSRRVG